MQQREAVVVSVRAGAPELEILGLGVFHGKIVQQAKRALVMGRGGIVALA